MSLALSTLAFLQTTAVRLGTVIYLLDKTRNPDTILAEIDEMVDKSFEEVMPDLLARFGT